jgi:hypothetical protein
MSRRGHTVTFCRDRRSLIINTPSFLLEAVNSFGAVVKFLFRPTGIRLKFNIPKPARKHRAPSLMRAIVGFKFLLVRRAIIGSNIRLIRIGQKNLQELFIILDEQAI